MRYIFIALLFCLTSSIYSQTKIDNIKKLIELSNYDLLGETMVDGYLDIYKDKLDGNETLVDSMKVWVSDGHETMMDSIIISYDKHFTDKDIEEMLKFYNTKVGKKITKLTPLITEETMRAGKNWANHNLPLLEEKLAPILEKEKQKYSYEALYNPDELFPNLKPYKYSTPESSSRIIESDKFGYTVNYNADDYRLIDCKILNPVADVCFESIDKTVYATIIVEGIQADLRQLKGVALSNMYAATKEVELGEIGFISLNGLEFLNINLEATIQGIDLVYDNYYITPEWGVLQFLTFCTKGDHAKSAKIMKELNNGLKLK